MSDFVNTLKKLRTSKGLTQKQLGSILNVTQNAVFNWENGKTQPTIEMLEHIASVFEVEPSYLLGWSSESYVMLKAHEDADLDEYGTVVDSILISEKNLLRQYNVLNNIGKAEAIKRVSELKHIPGFTGKDDLPFD